MYLYHGTSSNRASKIIKKGFRASEIDAAVFFAEDLRTAEYFALTVKSSPHETSPQSFTVIILIIPDDIAKELLIRNFIGVFRGVSCRIKPGDSIYEWVLHENDKIRKFNDAMIIGTIKAQRWRI